MACLTKRDLIAEPPVPGELVVWETPSQTVVSRVRYTSHPPRIEYHWSVVLGHGVQVALPANPFHMYGTLRVAEDSELVELMADPKVTDGSLLEIKERLLRGGPSP